MRDFKELERKFFEESTAYLNERADARLARIDRFKSSCDYDNAILERAYFRLWKARDGIDDYEDKLNQQEKIDIVAEIYELENEPLENEPLENEPLENEPM